MAFHAGPPTPQKPEPVVETSRDLGRCHRPAAGRGELDRERDAVETSTDLPDRRRGSDSSNSQIGTSLSRASAEQPDRVDREEATTTRHDVLAAKAERFAARGKHANVRASGTDRHDNRAGGLDDVLTVVEHDERVPPREMIDDALQTPIVRPTSLAADCREDRRRAQPRASSPR